MFSHARGCCCFSTRLALVTWRHEWCCAGTYALYLPILAGMSGGGVFTNDTHLFATNDFSVTSPGCSSGNCYNGMPSKLHAGT